MSPAAAQLVGAGIGAAVNTGSGILNYISQRQTNEFNRNMVNQQNQWNLRQWQLENAYNSPSNVIARLRAAGLNPALMYEGGAGQLTSAPSPDIQSSRDIAPQMTGMPTMSDFAGIGLALSQIKLNKSQERKNNAETGLYEEQINTAKELTKKAANEAGLLSLELKTATETYQQKMDTILAEFVGRKEQAELSKEEAIAKKKYVLDTAKAEYDAIRAEADRLLAVKGVAEEQRNLIKKQVEEYNQLIEKLKKDNQWYTADKIIGYICDIGSVASSFIGLGNRIKATQKLGKLADAAQQSRVANAAESVDLDGYNIYD